MVFTARWQTSTVMTLRSYDGEPKSANLRVRLFFTFITISLSLSILLFLLLFAFGTCCWGLAQLRRDKQQRIACWVVSCLYLCFDFFRRRLQSVATRSSFVPKTQREGWNDFPSTGFILVVAVLLGVLIRRGKYGWLFGRRFIMQSHHQNGTQIFKKIRWHWRRQIKSAVRMAGVIPCIGIHHLIKNDVRNIDLAQPSVGLLFCGRPATWGLGVGPRFRLAVIPVARPHS